MTTPERVGKYQILSKIADGGMAEVFLAVLTGDEGFQKRVALKMILPFFARDESFVRSFINEARICGQLQHPNLVQVYEFDNKGDSLYLAMEFIDGLDLERIITHQKLKRKPMTASLVAEIVLQMLEGLDYAHNATNMERQPLKVVHRDLKPSNVLIDQSGFVKIVDFGVAKASNNLYKTVNQGTAKGTVSYMSPEQASGRTDLGPASDLFSVGTILYEMLSGDRMFDGENLFAILDAVRSAPLEGYITARQVPPIFQPILRKALTRELSGRYQSAREMARDLRHAFPELPGPSSLSRFVEQLRKEGLEIAGVPPLQANRHARATQLAQPGLDTPRVVATLPSMDVGADDPSEATEWSTVRTQQAEGNKRGPTNLAQPAHLQALLVEPDPEGTDPLRHIDLRGLAEPTPGSALMSAEAEATPISPAGHAAAAVPPIPAPVFHSSAAPHPAPVAVAAPAFHPTGGPAAHGPVAHGPAAPGVSASPAPAPAAARATSGPSQQPGTPSTASNDVPPKGREVSGASPMGSLPFELTGEVPVRQRNELAQAAGGRPSMPGPTGAAAASVSAPGSNQGAPAAYGGGSGPKAAPIPAQGPRLPAGPMPRVMPNPPPAQPQALVAPGAAPAVAAPGWGGPPVRPATPAAVPAPPARPSVSVPASQLPAWADEGPTSGGRDALSPRNPEAAPGAAQSNGWVRTNDSAWHSPIGSGSDWKIGQELSDPNIWSKQTLPQPIPDVGIESLLAAPPRWMDQDGTGKEERGEARNMTAEGGRPNQVVLLPPSPAERAQKPPQSFPVALGFLALGLVAMLGGGLWAFFPRLTPVTIELVNFPDNATVQIFGQPDCTKITDNTCQVVLKQPTSYLIKAATPDGRMTSAQTYTVDPSDQKTWKINLTFRAPVPTPPDEH